MESVNRGPVVVALGFGPEGPGLVRTASALARQEGRELFCLTLDTGRSRAPGEAEALSGAQALAKSLGAVLASEAAVSAAEGLRAFAERVSASTIVLGRGRRRFPRPSLPDQLARSGLEAAVVAVASRPESPSPPAALARRRDFFGENFGESLGHYAAAVVLIAAVTGLNLALAGYAGYWAAAITYLAAISISALFLDRWPVLVAAFLSAAAWDFFFIPPRFQLNVSRTEDVLMLALYLVVALCSGWLTGRLRTSERLLAAREARLSRLSSLASDLAGAGLLGYIVEAGSRAIAEAFGVECVFILAGEGGALKRQAESGWEPLDELAREAARIAFERGQAAGRFSSIEPRSEWRFLPLEGAARSAPGRRVRLGVVGLRPASDAQWWGEEAESYLRTMVLTIAGAVSREMQP